MSIRDNVHRLLGELPAGIALVAVAKGRTPEEVAEAVGAGVSMVGENYVQEAERARGAVGGGVQWHFIGHLQRNKVKKAVALCDMIQTVDSVELAREIDRLSAALGKVMPVLVEINSAREKQKTGVMPEEAGSLVKSISGLAHARVMGLMTIGPFTADFEEIRPYFTATRALFEQLKAMELPNVEMRYLSMGMTDSYKVALQEGANMVRIGTAIFGARPSKPPAAREEAVTDAEALAREERVREKTDAAGNRWRKVYFGGGRHFINWLAQCRELGEVEVEEIPAAGFACFAEGGEKVYRIWMKEGGQPSLENQKG